MTYNFSEEEQKILKFWEEKKIFEKSLKQTKGKKPFVFYDGPPFATGSPHYGHLLQSAVKDAIPRYKTMRGFYVERQWGWDCHGLPIENIVEKELGTKSKKDILKMGVKKFNDLCRDKIFTFIKDWENIIPRFGRWADMKNPYLTMDFEYMQSEWWAFKVLYEKGLIYEDYRSLHICPRCETTLSQGEVADGYKEIKDLAVTVKFKVKNPEKHGLPKNTYFLAWTTTPWTLPGNVALAVGGKIKYVLVQFDKENLIIAKESYSGILQNTRISNSEIKREFRGKDFIGIKYEPLFDYYAKDKNLKNRENGWKVYAADFIKAEDGTGIAHEAPAFGADDWELLKKNNLPFVQHVNVNGTFKPEVADFQGENLSLRAKNNPEEVREVDLIIKKYLEQKGLLFASEKYLHAYPHCWRCDTALLNYAASSWFVAVEKIKPKLLQTAKKINWSPPHIKEGRFGQWLKGAKDWSISRQRFWANTIPIWRCEKCKKEFVFGSAKELEKASGVKIKDLHKDIVDEITFSCGCLSAGGEDAGKAKRVPDVLDTWFDSGSVPFASLHYPLKNKDKFKQRLPADFIGEAQDQTRAWFYYQHVLISALFSKEAFKNVIVTGIVLAEDGKKMSKKLQNYPDPMQMIEKYGADTMRFYMLSSPVVGAENLFFSEKSLDELAKKNIGRLNNVLEFYNLYKNGTLRSSKSKNILDKWILMRLTILVKDSTDGYENYKIASAVRPVSDFIDDLSVWYLRRSRERFKDGSNQRDTKSALSTLRYVLYQLSLVLAPSMPFFAEYLFQETKENKDKESVHLSIWPKVNKKFIDKKLAEQMSEVRELVSAALAERQEKGIKVRQPLASLKIQNTKSEIRNNNELLDLIKDEVNVKEIVFDGKIKNEVELDTKITKELKEEGIVRDLIRQIQDMRKEAGLKPKDKVNIYFFGDRGIMDILSKNKGILMKETNVNVLFHSGENERFLVKKELKVENQILLVKITK